MSKTQDDDWLWNALHGERPAGPGPPDTGMDTVQLLREEVHHVVESVIEGGELSAPTGRKRRRRPRAASLLLFASVVIAGGTVIWWWQESQARRSAALFQDELAAIEDSAARAVPAWPENSGVLADLVDRTRAVLLQLPTAEAQLAEVAGPADADVDSARSQRDRAERQASRLRRLRDHLLPDLTRRLAWSRAVAAQTIDAYRDRWNECAARMASSPQQVPAIAPQLGLVPLGTDPDTGAEEFAHVLSGAIAFREDGRLRLDEPHGVVFVLCPGDGGANNSPFFLAKHELSRAQWGRLAGDLPELQLAVDEKPSHEISAVLLERWGLRQPTEDEWRAVRMATGKAWVEARFAAAAEPGIGVRPARSVQPERARP